MATAGDHKGPPRPAPPPSPLQSERETVEHMQRVAFIMHIKSGTEEEYRRRHRQVWPELLADLKRAGCSNYSIFLRGLDLFAYMEVEDFQRFLNIMAASQASQRWEEQMGDILVRETNPATGFPYVLSEVFHLD
ncbi:MAG TPA: L-rhamnose mutarotase [Ktedonobacteraceae bacterium]|nr:L-rhamnose mutarotase [Ktedonobacteraceae bacterium]